MTDVPPASRNASCPCGSGRRYKHCHGAIGAPTTAPMPDEGHAQPDAESLFRLGNACRERGDLERSAGALSSRIGIRHRQTRHCSTTSASFTARSATRTRPPISSRERSRSCPTIRPRSRTSPRTTTSAGAMPKRWRFSTGSSPHSRSRSPRSGRTAACASRAWAIRRPRPTSFERALALEPDRLGVRLDAGNAYLKLEHSSRHSRHFDAAHRLDPALPLRGQLGARPHAVSRALGWLRRASRAFCSRSHSTSIASPTNICRRSRFLSLTDDPALQLQAARSATRHAVPQGPPAIRVLAARRGSGRLRLGFVSSDFRDHPVGRLVVGLLERLDRAHVGGIRLRRRPRAVGRHRDASRARRRPLRPSSAGATGMRSPKRVRDDAIDVLFDLNGYTGRADCWKRSARRPAPMQVNFLGYTGTLGCSAYDYILADSYCIPPAAERWYEERVLRVDPCYLPSDPARELAAEPLTRAPTTGCPDDALVLCCFAPVYKILPDFLDGLQPILERPSRCGALVAARRGGRGRASSRRSASTRHRGRDNSCSLRPRPPRATSPDSGLPISLSTRFPFGAHTTVNDALFAGLPVLAVAGRSFAARASASQVRAAGLPEFVAESVADYFLKLRALRRRASPSGGSRAAAARRRRQRPVIRSRPLRTHVRARDSRRLERLRAATRSRRPLRGRACAAACRSAPSSRCRSRIAARTPAMKRGSVARRTAISTYSGPLFATVSVTPRLREDGIAGALAVPLADERHHRHSHVERLERAVDAAERHRDRARNRRARNAPDFPRRRGPAGRTARRSGGDSGGAGELADRAPRAAGLAGENASFARGMRSSTSRHSARQRRDSLSAADERADDDGVVRNARAAARWNGCSAAGATWRKG